MLSAAATAAVAASVPPPPKGLPSYCYTEEGRAAKAQGNEGTRRWIDSLCNFQLGYEAERRERGELIRNAMVKQAGVDRARVQTMIDAREAPGHWSTFKGPKHADCNYFGIRLFDFECSAANLNQYVWVESIYADAQRKLRSLSWTPQTAEQRVAWVKLAETYISQAHWASGVRPAFLYNAGEAVLGGEQLTTFGPPKAREFMANMWTAVRSQGRQLLFPLSIKNLFRFSYEPSLNPPWMEMTNGKDEDSQRIAERRRGSRRRHRRGMKRAGFVSRNDWISKLGGSQKDVDARGADGDASEEYLLTIMGSGGAAFAPPPRKISDAVVPSGDMLLAYIRTWVDHIIATPMKSVVEGSFVRYLEYMKRFPDTFGLTLDEIDKMQKATQKAMAMGIAGTAGGLVIGIAAAINPIAGAVAAVVVALVQFFTWLFGGAYRGCPKAPRPFLLRSLSDAACNIDVAGGDQSMVQVMRKLEASGQSVGYHLPTPFVSAAEDEAFNEPVLEDEMPLVPSLVPWGKVALFGGAAVLSGLAIHRLRG